MTKIAVALLASLLGAIPAAAWQYTPGPPSSSGPTMTLGNNGLSMPKKEKPPEFRTLTGVVLDKADSPLKDAVIHLKNRKTKTVASYVADADGAYRFPNLSRTVDYEIYAELKGQKSPTKTLSSFDSRTNAKINLYIEVKKEEKQEAKQEEKKDSKEEKKEGK